MRFGRACPSAPQRPTWGEGVPAALSILAAIRRYAAHDDPLVAAANLIALVVAWNQPFYPVYLYWLVSPDIAPSFFTFLSTPFFLAVPAVARCDARVGRALLPLTGIANTVLSAKLFGEASGVELFLAPCVMIAAMLFRRGERLLMLSLVGLAFVVFGGLHGRYGAPLHLYSPEEYQRFLSLNAVSVGTLIAFVGLCFANAVAQLEAGGRGPRLPERLGGGAAEDVAERRGGRG